MKGPFSARLPLPLCAKAEGRGKRGEVPGRIALLRNSLVLAFISASALAGAQTPVTQTIPDTTYKGLDINGYLDFFYQMDFGHPKGPENGRWYDTSHDQYRLAAADLDLAYVPSLKHPFGFHITALEGPDSNILAATEPGRKRSYKDFSQAYVSYIPHTKMPLDIDFGKWYAFVGYESLDSRTNDNYSRSFTFTSLEPDYMTGFRIIATTTPKLTINGYLYQGYNEVSNSNSTTMTGLGAVYTFNSKLTATLQGYNGKESNSKLNDAGTYGGIGFPTPGPSWVTQTNAIVVYQKNSRDKFAFDGTYANACDKGTWNGEAVYYRRQFNSQNDACLRIERADDPSGLRFDSGPLLLESATLTYDYATSPNLLFRFELREDFASKAFFNAANGPAKQRTTLTFAQVFKF
jgi:Putative beta-barrel porin-2, OmpL-like. bbp2